MERYAKMEVRLDELLSALSLALDLSENKSMEHSRRTAYIAYRIADKLKVSSQIKDNVYYASFLHDIGVANMPYEVTLGEIHNNLDLKKVHSDMGYNIVKKLPFDQSISEYILYHHENYDGTGPNFMKKDEIPLGAQIVCLADYFEVHHKKKDISTIEKQRMNLLIKENKFKIFNPNLVDVLLELMDTDKFWLDLSINVNHEILNLISPEKVKVITLDELERISEAFAMIIDGKSKFTYSHSYGLAQRVYSISKHIGYNEEKSTKMKIAGYLHDIGKLAVPNNILDKEGKLTLEEFNVIKTHPYYTKLILSQVRAFKDNIARWAGNHHEKLSGKGYPERLRDGELSDEDQIVGICDIYQALVEDRPYRKGMEKSESLEIIKKVVDSGGFHKRIYKVLSEVI